MDTQNQHKLANSSSGHESHGVHVCHKCGWPFPNPHPSAKHRRAHKKVCGTIEGYKLGIDLEGSSHSSISIDEQLSDEDHHTPSQKVLEASGSEKGNGGAGDLRNRSEEEVFSDAVAEFGISEEKGLQKESNTIPTVECGPFAEAVKPPETTTESIEVQHSETPESKSTGFTNASGFSELSSSSTISSVSDSLTEHSALPVDGDRNALADETQKDDAVDSEKTETVDGVFDGSSTIAEQDTDETAVVTESSPEKLPKDGLVCSKIPETDVPAEVELVEHAIADTRDVSGGINSDYVIENKGEADKNVHLISVTNVHEVDDCKVMLEDFKDHTVANLRQSATSEFGLSEDKGGEVKGLAVEENCQSNQSEGTEISAHGSDTLVKDAAIEEEADSSQIGKIASDSSPDVKESYDISGEALPDMATEGILVVEDCDKTLNSDSSGDLTEAIEVDHAEKSVTVPESTVSASEKVYPGTKLWEGEEAGSYGKVDVRKLDTAEYIGDASNESQVDNSNGLVKERSLEHTVVASELADKFCDQETDLRDAGKDENVEIQKDDLTGDSHDAAIVHVKDETREDNRDGPAVESWVENVIVAPESADKPAEPIVNPATNSQEGTVTSDHETEKGIIERGIEHGTETKEDLPMLKNITPESSDHLQEVTRSLNSVDNQVKEQSLSSLDAKSSIQSFSDNSAKESNVASGLGSESFPGENDRQQLGGSMDLSIDSSSQTDSLENNWGSVSVLSIQSDAQAVLDPETVPPNESQAEKNNSKHPKPSTEGQHPDKSDMFEPPSFMTLVEPLAENGLKPDTSETDNSSNPQQPNNAQAGWFPSITHVAHESQGRKKNEEIIAKVTNWSAGKQQHTPLKSLLGEASVETQKKSPKRKGDKPATTVNTILAPESPAGQTSGKEIRKEWDSPARYPAEIRREKRKPKSRPYWAQFMCCSSVH